MAKETPVSDKAQRRETARLKALELQAEQLKQERRSRMVILASILAGVVLLGALVFFILSKAPSDLEGIAEIPQDVAVPTVADETGAIIFAKEGVDPETTPTLDVYLDFMCGACAQFEASNAAFIEQAIADGDIIYRAHPLSILNSQYSETIGATFVYLAENSPEHALDFAAEAFARQSGSGLTGAQMQEIAIDLGVEKSVAKDAVSGEYQRFIVAASQVTLGDESLQNAEGKFVTPSVFINSVRSEVQWPDPAALPAAVAEAAAQMGN